MTAMASHLSTAELEARYKTAADAAAKSHFHAVWLLSLGYTAGEVAELGQKLPRPLVDQRCDMTETVALGEGDMALQHDEHARPRLTGLEQQLSMRIGADFAEMPHARDLG